MTKVNTVSIKIGKSIRKIREEKAITQEQLALDAGLNRAYIGYIERGERNPTLKTIEKIAKILKVSTKKLL